jgi:hypothetical protein
VVEHGKRVDRVELDASQTRRRIRGNGARGRGFVIAEEEPSMRRTFGCDERRDVVLHETGVQIVCRKFGMSKEALQKPDVRGHTLDPEFAQRAIGLPHHVGEL